MMTLKVRTLGLLCVGFLGSISVQASTWVTKPNCDMPATSLKELKTESQDKCQQVCDETEGCKGIVYITGWRKCSLKADGKKQATMRFISGELNDKHVYEPGSFKTDNDHSGKDLERIVLDVPDQCGKACESRADCQAFTFIEGYRVCWLKKKGGKFSDKVFHCGFKKLEG